MRRGRASWDAGHAPSLRPLRCTQVPPGVKVHPCSPPLSSALGRVFLIVSEKMSGVGGTREVFKGGGARQPRRGFICPWAAAWLLLSFHNFGYKVIQLKEVTENKAMREEEGMYSAWRDGGASRVRLLLLDGWGREEKQMRLLHLETPEPDRNPPLKSNREAYFLLLAGGSSPASPSSSAWICQTWWPLRCLVCHSLLQVVWKMRKQGDKLQIIPSANSNMCPKDVISCTKIPSSTCCTDSQ